MKIERARLQQIGLLILLAVCFGQVLWWILDQTKITRAAIERGQEYEESMARAAALMQQSGIDPQQIESLFPALHFGPDGELLTGDSGIVSKLERDRLHRLIRYGAEGAFFLVVLIIGMGVLAETLKRHAELHRREHNFLAAVSHELKSPIASIRLSAETISLRDPPHEKRQALVQRMLSDLSRLEKMVMGLLDTTLVDEGCYDYRPERVELRRVADLVVTELRPQAQAQQVILFNLIPEELEVRVDPIAAQTILHNLVDNAVKATAAASGGQVRITGQSVSGQVKVEVSDTGVGIRSDELKKIFKKFYRPGEELRRESRGSGLGLYLAQRFAELGRGTVVVTSEGPGRGSVFTVSWPALRPAPGPPAPEDRT